MMGKRARRLALPFLAVLVATAVTVGAAKQHGAEGQPEPTLAQPEPTLAFDCAPPHPGPPKNLGETLCVGTSEWRRRLDTLRAIPSSGGTAGSPRWSPDGQRLLFRLQLSQGTDQRDDVGMINLDGSSFVNLTNYPAHANWGANWSPDGKQIVFNSGNRLFVMNADGSGLRKITSIWGEFPYWSPDGRLIGFQSNRCNCGSEYDVYTVRPDGSGLHRLTSTPGGESGSGWSPDGRFFAFGRDPDANPGIWIIPREGGSARHLLPTAPDVQLRGGEWARDGNFLMFAIPGGSSPEDPGPTFIYRVSQDGTAATKLLDDASGADLRPSGHGKARSHLSLTHRWLSRHELKLSGQLIVGETLIGGRAIKIGRLGRTLPTHRVRTIRTRPDGRFTVKVRVANRRKWRVATAFFGGSRTEWSTTAFESLRSRAD
jgi:WD40-like Beta Propeller Repeat